MKKNKIMIVDDDKTFLEELQEMLVLSGYEIVAVNKSIDAFDTVLVVKPDVILLDMKMDGLNGYQIIERLKKSSETDFIPIIVVTGYLTNGTHSTLSEIYDINTCIKKPFNPLDVISQIEKALDKNRRQGN